MKSHFTKNEIYKQFFDCILGDKMKTEQMQKVEFEYPVPVFMYEMVDGKFELKEHIICPNCGFGIDENKSLKICINCGLVYSLE